MLLNKTCRVIDLVCCRKLTNCFSSLQICQCRSIASVKKQSLAFPSRLNNRNNGVCFTGCHIKRWTQTTSQYTITLSWKPFRSYSVFTGEKLSMKDEELVDQLFEGILKQERGNLARGITLVESSHPRKSEQAQLLLSRILRYNRTMRDLHAIKPQSFRIGNL